jgi:hypothetical protein
MRILEAKTTMEDLTILSQVEEEAAIAEIDDQIEKKGSVVKAAYKLKYKARAKEKGIGGKAAKRSTWDWTAQIMATETLTKKAKTDVDALYAFLDANGVDHSRWTNRKAGWEGRLRMTGGLALRRIVAERGTLFLRDGTELVVPEDEMARLVAKFDL